MTNARASKKNTAHRWARTLRSAKKQVNKAKKRLNSVLKLDTGVEIHIKAGDEEPVLERGFDPRRA
jgi:transcriptional regulator